MNKIAPSELILNPDGSIYHLNLKPEHIADTVIFVGDQNRVPRISKYFEHIEFDLQKREFRTITGTYKNKRITVISTGIGPDNIDIVINELDALVNIDLDTRTIKEKHHQLDIIRIGTSGSLQEDIPVDSFVLGKYGLGLDGLLHSYDCKNILETEIEEAFIKHTQWSQNKARPYIVKGSSGLEKKLISEKVYTGITATAPGFYGPQGRVLRLKIQDESLNKNMHSFSYNGIRLSNLEMETSAIYGLSRLLGHRAISMNAIIANRVNGTFSKDPYRPVDALIKYTLDKLAG